MNFVRLSQAVCSGLLILVTTNTSFAEAIRGDRLPAEALGSGYVESMDDVVARDSVTPRRHDGRSAPESRFGEWKVPSRSATSVARSGLHHVVNSWGDTRMGITFPEVVDVQGAWFAGQEGERVWTSGVAAVGYLEGLEVKRTGWFRDIGDRPSWFAMDLCGVDRIEILSEAVVDRSGWYAMDDLTFTPLSEGSGEVIVDFDDLGYHTTLSGSRYADLIWEFGTGFDTAEPVPAPRIPPGVVDEPAVVPGDGGIAAGGGGTRPQLLDSFQGVIRGDAGAFSFPPDTCGAVGPDHFVIAINRNVAVYDKTSGAELMNVFLPSFMPGASGDPRVLFDQHSWRWIVLATDFSNEIFIAVSLTDNAMGSWFKTSFNTSQGSDSGKWPDYPTLGVDANGIYTASYMVGGSNRMTIFAVDKAPLVAPSPSLGTVTAFRDLPWEGAIQPVHAYGNPDGQYFVSIASSSGLRLRSVDPPLTSPTMTERGFFDVVSFSSPPDAAALGSSTPLSTVDRRLMMSVYRDGSIWTSHTIGLNNRAACRWYQLDVDTLTVAQYGNVSSTFFHYYFPSIMVNSRGGVAMGFSGSNNNQYAGAYYTGRNVTDPPGQMDSPLLYKGGSAPQNNIDSFGRNRWGDYSYTTVDPVDESTFYTLQEYAHAENIWGTYIAVLNGGDCNGTGIEDSCDVSCGASGGACDVPGCGQSTDCNLNDIPDECEVQVGACCFPDGDCCNLTPSSVCQGAWGVFHGAGTDCATIDPACAATEARISCVVDDSLASPGGSVRVEAFVEGVNSLSTYQVSLATQPLDGTSNLTLDCSGCTGGPNEPTCSTRVDEDRSDYVFLGEDGFAAVSCLTGALGAVLITGAVDVDANPSYGGEFTFDVPADAQIGDEFQITINTGFSSSFLIESSGDFVPYLPGTPCTFSVQESVDCEAPIVEGGGSKSLLVTPALNISQALLVTGDPSDQAVDCVSMYVQEDGTLGPVAVFRTSAEWGTVAVHGENIIPSADYRVQADCGSLVEPQLSPAAPVATWVWGDVEFPPNGVVNFADIFLVVQAFQLDYSNVTLERADLEPCEPNRTVNFADIQSDVQAFQGQTYVETGCPVPCP